MTWPKAFEAALDNHTTYRGYRSEGDTPFMELFLGMRACVRTKDPAFVRLGECEESKRRSLVEAHKDGLWLLP